MNARPLPTLLLGLVAALGAGGDSTTGTTPGAAAPAVTAPDTPVADAPDIGRAMSEWLLDQDEVEELFVTDARLIEEIRRSMA